MAFQSCFAPIILSTKFLCISFFWELTSTQGRKASHKRTEGRAPVWGFEFTKKSRYNTGGFGRNRCNSGRKIVGSGGDWWRATPFLEQPSPIIFWIYLDLREQFRIYQRTLLENFDPEAWVE